jgi:hypothetical protein
MEEGERWKGRRRRGCWCCMERGGVALREEREGGVVVVKTRRMEMEGVRVKRMERERWKKR